MDSQKIGTTLAVGKGTRVKSLTHFFLPLSIVFLVAFSASAFHNFYESNTRIIYFADSRNYLTSTAYYAAFFLDTIKGNLPQGLIADENMRRILSCDGPVLSTIFGMAFALLGCIPGPDDWKTIVSIQSLFHGLSASIAACLVWSVLHRKRYALAAGLAFALYPPALIAAGRFMTETFGCFLIVAFLATLFASQRRPVFGFVFGLLAGMAWTMRILLAPPVVLATAAAMFYKRLSLRSLVGFIVGFVMILGTWVYFSSHYLGRAMFTTERAAVHNAFVGWDKETDGFQTSSPTEKEKAFVSSDPMSVVWGQIASDPIASLNLIGKKVTRIYAYPFNDFRHGCLGLSDIQIIGIHWILLFFSLAGIFMYAARGYQLFDACQRARINIVLIFLCSMQGYFMVEGNARYGFSAFPIMIFFATIAFFIAVSWLHARRVKPLLLSVLAACATIALIVLLEPILSKSMGDSETVTIDPQKPVTAVIELKIPKTRSLKEQSLIIIDGDKGLGDCLVTVNGKALPDSLVSYSLLDSDFYSQFNVMKDYGYALGAEIDDLRQWRAIPVPTSLLQLEGPNKIVIQPRSGPAQIYVNKAVKERIYRDLEFLSVNRLLNSHSGFEARPFSPVKCARTEKAFYSSALRNDQGVTTASAIQPLQIYIGLIPQREPKSAFAKGEQKIGKKFIHKYDQKEFPLLTRVFNSNELTVNKYVTTHSFTDNSLPLPDFSDFSHLRVKLTGEVRSVSDDGRAGIAVATAPKNDSAWFLARLPYYVKAPKQWQKFEIADVVPFNIYASGISRIEIALYPGPWPEVAGVGPSVAGPQIYLRDLKVEIEPFNTVDVRGKNILMN